MSNSIKVVARFRPQNRTEIELGGQPIVTFESEDTCLLDVGDTCSNVDGVGYH
jgi:kinesin family protein 5